MENRIDKIITLSNDKKYMIIDQGNYDGKYYYLTSKVDENNNLSEEFNILEDNGGKVTNVKDEKLFNALIDYFKKRTEAS